MQHEIDVKTKCRDVIYYIDGGFDEFALVRTGDETRENFYGEPSVADAFDVEESIVGVGSSLIEDPGRCVAGRVDGYVLDDGYPHVRMCFQAKRQD